MAHRFFITPREWNPQAQRLTGAEARHATDVLRLREGDAVVVFDGLGSEQPARVVGIGKDEVVLAPGQLARTSALPCRIAIGQAIPKGKNMDLIVQKATELGAAAVYPIVSDRTVVRLDKSEAESKREKWQRVAVEACKQCGQTWLPEVAVPATLDQMLEETATAGLRLAASLQPDARSLRQLLGKGPPPPGGMAVLIGPEGDVTPDEAIKFQAAGWLPWSLGALTLRSETAAICALSILRYEVHTD